MKRILVVVLLIINLFNSCLNVIGDEGIDRLYLSKTGNLWDDYVNMMNIVFPGDTISGLYYHKIYAKYDSDVGGFVILDKIPSHISYTKKVEKTAFGLCFSYNPEYKSGREFGKKNYSVWSNLRVGDVLYPYGIDFTKKYINVDGKLSDGSLNTKAYFTVSYSNRKYEPTAYDGKTIVALGDSVTCNGGWTESVGDLIGCKVINSGVSADRVTEALKRFDEDVKSYSPDIVLIMFGINDCIQYHYSEKTVITFKNELIELWHKCREIGAEVVYITPNNVKIDSLNFERFKEYGGLSACFPQFIDTVKEVAEETASHCIDVYRLFDNYKELLCDSVHPNKEGYSLITEKVAEYLIQFADVISGEKIEGFVTTGEREVSLSDTGIIVPIITVGDIKKFFCNEVLVYKNDTELSDNEYITDECTVFWIDKLGNKRDSLKIFLKKDKIGNAPSI